MAVINDVFPLTLHTIISHIAIFVYEYHNQNLLALRRLMSQGRTDKKKKSQQKQLFITAEKKERTPHVPQKFNNESF